MRHVHNHVTGKFYDSFSMASFELGEFSGLFENQGKRKL